jgi:hypothetical protein
MAYSILAKKHLPHHCKISTFPREVKGKYKLSEGVSMGESAPQDLKLNMSEDEPGFQISDFIFNTLNIQIVNQRAKKLIEDYTHCDIEYIRFSLINHKGRVASDECYIINVIGTIDCVDKDKTEGEWHPVEPTTYQFLDKLVLDENKIPPTSNLFRISVFPKVLIIRDDLREIFEKNNVSGIEYLEMGEEISL